VRSASPSVDETTRVNRVPNKDGLLLPGAGTTPTNSDTNPADQAVGYL